MPLPPHATKPKKIEVTEARQRRPGSSLLAILVISALAGSVALMAVFFLFFTTPIAPGSQDATSEATDQSYEEPHLTPS